MSCCDYVRRVTPWYFLVDDTDVGLYIILHPQFRMVLGSEEIWNMDYPTVIVQVVQGDEAIREHNQAG